MSLISSLAESRPRAPAKAALRVLPRASRLASMDALDAVDALMAELALAAPTDVAGRIVREHLAVGGKRLRARLALAALEAFGASRAEGIAWAAACELLHNATLVHDDLQDGDRLRRGRATVWARHGTAQAINAGDLLLMLPFLALEHLSASPQVRWLLARTLAGHAADTVRGQALEQFLSATGEAVWDAYHRAIIGKTGALFRLPVEGAALLAGRSPDEARRLGSAFCSLGVLFQLQDDVLDLFGDKGRGEIGCDLREGKVSALVVEHLILHPSERVWLLALLATPRERTPEPAVADAVEQFRTRGALRAVLERIEMEVDALLDDAVLLAHRPLWLLAREATEAALVPIAHLRSRENAHLARYAVAP